jgi:hypothetical protein
MQVCEPEQLIDAVVIASASAVTIDAVVARAAPHLITASTPR